MKLFHQIPVYTDTPETLCEKSNITKLVEYERYCSSKFFQKKT